jgi:hypothetical protein
MTAWSREALTSMGFVGWVPFAELPSHAVPRSSGIYIVYRTATSAPAFLERSGAGWQGDVDPSLPRDELLAEWVPGVSVLYIGKGDAQKKGITDRLRQYRRHGEGHNPSHWGGRLIWQLADHAELLVAWLETPNEDPGDVESELRSRFVADFGKRPFANLNDTRQRRRSLQP